MFDRVTAAAQEMEQVLAELDARSMVGSQPAAGLELLGRHERVVAAARSKLTARAAQMNHWQRQGYRSFEDWYAATFGTSAGQARRKTRAAKNLADNDRTAGALADGDISEDEADVVADAAKKNPDAEKELLDTARNKHKSHRDLKDRAAKAKAAGESDRERADRLRKGRSAGWGTDRDGFWNLNAKFEPHVGAEIKARLQAEVDRIFTASRQQGTREPFDRYRADALANLISGPDPATDPTPDTHTNGNRTANSNSTGNSNSTANGNSTGNGTAKSNSTGNRNGSGDSTGNRNGSGSNGNSSGSGSGDPDGSSEPQLDLRPRPSTDDTAAPAPDHSTNPPDPPDRPADPSPGSAPAPGRVGKEMVLDINLETLRRGCVKPGETCHIRGVGQVPVEIARRWVDDAFIKAVIRDGEDVKRVSHYGRHIPAHVRTALDLIEQTCAVPGCSNLRIEYDHNQRHADHGPSSTDNLRPLCTHHHRQRTHHDYELAGTPGDRRWIGPDGRVLFADQPEHLMAEPARAP